MGLRRYAFWSNLGATHLGIVTTPWQVADLTSQEELRPPHSTKCLSYCLPHFHSIGKPPGSGGIVSKRMKMLADDPIWANIWGNQYLTPLVTRSFRLVLLLI